MRTVRDISVINASDGSSWLTPHKQIRKCDAIGTFIGDGCQFTRRKISDICDSPFDENPLKGIDGEGPLKTLARLESKSVPKKERHLQAKLCLSSRKLFNGLDLSKVEHRRRLMSAHFRLYDMEMNSAVWAESLSFRTHSSFPSL
jgi:hypothetical protein